MAKVNSSSDSKNDFKNLFCQLVETQTKVQQELTTAEDLLSESLYADKGEYQAIQGRIRKLEEKYVDIKQENEALVAIKQVRMSNQNINKAKENFLKCENKLTTGLDAIQKNIGVLSVKNRLMIDNLEAHIKTLKSLREEHSRLLQQSVIVPKDVKEDAGCMYSKAQGDAGAGKLQGKFNENIKIQSSFTSRVSPHSKRGEPENMKKPGDALALAADRLKLNDPQDENAEFINEFQDSDVMNESNNNIRIRSNLFTPDNCSLDLDQAMDAVAEDGGVLSEDQFVKLALSVMQEDDTKNIPSRLESFEDWLKATAPKKESKCVEDGLSPTKGLESNAGSLPQTSTPRDGLEEESITSFRPRSPASLPIPTPQAVHTPPETESFLSAPSSPVLLKESRGATITKTAVVGSKKSAFRVPSANPNLSGIFPIVSSPTSTLTEIGTSRINTIPSTPKSEFTASRENTKLDKRSSVSQTCVSAEALGARVGEGSAAEGEVDGGKGASQTVPTTKPVSERRKDKQPPAFQSTTHPHSFQPIELPACTRGSPTLSDLAFAECLPLLTRTDVPKLWQDLLTGDDRIDESNSEGKPGGGNEDDEDESSSVSPSISSSHTRLLLSTLLPTGWFQSKEDDDDREEEERLEGMKQARHHLNAYIDAAEEVEIVKDGSSTYIQTSDIFDDEEDPESDADLLQLYVWRAEKEAEDREKHYSRITNTARMVALMGALSVIGMMCLYYRAGN